MYPERYPEGGVVALTRDSVRGILDEGGTILGTTNRGDPTAYPVLQPDGTYVEVDRTAELVQLFRAQDIDALVTVGGDGSLAIAYRLFQAGLRLIGVPKTIDNDLDKTQQTFGFDTAVSFASKCIDRLFSTATSHGRVIVVEVMGRYAGWIAVEAGVASGAHAILIPEIPFDLEPVAEMIEEREHRGAKFSIVVVAEGAAPRGGQTSVRTRKVGEPERLGGSRAGRCRPRGAHRQGVAHRRPRPPSPRRVTNGVRSGARLTLRGRRRTRPRCGCRRRDGVA